MAGLSFLSVIRIYLLYVSQVRYSFGDRVTPRFQRGHMRKLLAVLTALAFLFATPPNPNQQHDDDFLIYVVAQGTAEPIGKALKKKLSVSRPFAVATKDDVSKVVVLVSCM